MKSVVKILLAVLLFTYIGCASTLVSISKYIEHSRSGLDKKTTVIDTHTVYYLEGGKGENILLIHGFGADKDNWTYFAKYLTDRYHVVAPDLPGFGESSRINTESYSIDAQVKRVHRFAENMGLKKYHIVGNSMGGCIAGVYAAEYPGEVLSLGLFAPAGIKNEVETDFIADLGKGRNPLLLGSEEDFDRMLELCFDKKPQISGSVKTYLTDIAIKNKTFNEKVFREVMTDFALDKRMKDISAKTLVLWGDNDKILDMSGADFITKGIKNSRKVIIKDCGHTPMIERPEETAVNYLDFIR